MLKKLVYLAPDIPETRVVADLKQLNLNDRQIKALELLIDKGQTLTNSIYQKEFGVSRQTASRDLKDLIDKGQIYSTGKGKGTKYMAVNTNEA